MFYLNSGNDRREEKKINLKEKEKFISDLSPAIDSILNTFGIKKEWIKTTPQKELVFIKEVSIPNDVPSAEILFELQTAVLPYDLEINSLENIETGKITSELSDNKKLLAKLEFNRNSGIKRDVFELCIVLENVEKYNIDEINNILNYSSYYTVFLPRNLNRIDLQAEIINSRKEYIISFEIGDVQDYDADFRKTQDIRQKVNDICNYYQKDKGLVLFNPKKLYDFEKEIISNLSSCRGNIYSDTVLINLKLSKDSEKKYLQLESELEKLSKSQRVKKALVVDIPYSEFSSFLSVLQKLERKGFRFVSFLDYFKQK